MDKDDVRDVMAQEKARGSRSPRESLLRKHEQELLRKFRRALDLDDEHDFLEAIREIEPGADEERRRNALRIWRAYRRRA